MVDTDPLRVGDVRGVPRLGDPVVLGLDPVIAVYLSLHPGEAPEPPRLTLEISQDGQVVGRATPDLPAPDASGRVAYLGQFRADRFAPGPLHDPSPRAAGIPGVDDGDVLPGESRARLDRGDAAPGGFVLRPHRRRTRAAAQARVRGTR